MNNSRVKLATLTLGASLLAACGGGGSDEPAPPPPAAATITLSGQLTAPDATTPIANALVYVKDSSAGTAAGQARPLAALPCGAPPTASWAATCTGADGKFSFAAKVPASPTLVAVKGAFTLEKALVVSGDGALNVGTVALAPASASKFAVVAGAFDNIQDVLAKLGYGQVAEGRLVLGTEAFTLYDGDNLLGGTYKDADALFVDADNNGQADIFNHSVVFFNCGLNEAALDSPQNRAILRAYVEAGGRIYASDQAYDVVEQVFPAYLDFEGSVAPADQPEAIDAAQIGDRDLIVNASVDATLAAWLQGVGCVNGPCIADGKVHVEGFLDGWAVMAGVHPAQQAAVKTWASGPVTFTGQSEAVQRPLTVSFGVGQGRVSYTSYHTEPDAPTQGFMPQERVMQYLVFEL